MDWKLGFYIQLSILCSTFTLLLLYVICSRYVKHNKTIEKKAKNKNTMISIVIKNCHRSSFFYFADAGNLMMKETEMLKKMKHLKVGECHLNSTTVLMKNTKIR